MVGVLVGICTIDEVDDDARLAREILETVPDERWDEDYRGSSGTEDELVQ